MKKEKNSSIKDKIKSIDEIYMALKNGMLDVDEKNLTETSVELYREQKKLNEKKDALEKYTYENGDYTNINFTAMTNDYFGRSSTKLYSLDELTPTTIQKVIQVPKSNKVLLNRISRSMYNVMQDYKNIIKTFGNLLKYQHVLNPTVREIDPEDFMRNLRFLESFNYKMVFDRITKKLLRDDLYCGYVVSKQGSNIREIIDMPLDYCYLGGKDRLGNYFYYFDISYFDTYKDDLDAFPKEIQNLYASYLRDRNKKGRRPSGLLGKKPDRNALKILNIKNQVCFKFDVVTDYVLPYFASSFNEMLEYEEVKKQNYKDALNENYKIIHQKIPLYTKERGVDEFQLNDNASKHFHGELANAIGDKGTVATTPMDIEAITMKQTAQQLTNTAEFGLDNIYSGIGLSKQLANSSKAGSTALNKNIAINESMMFTVLRQYEGFLNKQLFYRNKSFNYKAKMLDLTINNGKELFDKYLSAGQSGMLKSYAPAALGIGQLELICGSAMEDALDFEKLLGKPFISAHLSSQKLDVTADGNENAVKEEVGDEADKKRDQDD